MNNLSLTLTEFQRLHKVFATLTVLAWALIFLSQWQLMGTDPITAGWRSFTAALTIITFVFGAFYKLAWKSSLIARWMGRPIVHGVWRGVLLSDYKRSKENPLEIPIIFVIRQTYLTLSIESFTNSQEGESKLEALIRNTRTESTRLSYVFELKRYYGSENKLTIGAGQLRLQDDNTVLRGSYWTNTPTHGELRLKLMSRDCEGVDCYEVAERRFPAERISLQGPSSAVTQNEN
ncbi:hypothetical protein SAMN05720382_101320 [Polaromonas sp. JS666]|nr:hypothetical protein SAMN05720382_101320 [Polaromonas sp. JS666]